MAIEMIINLRCSVHHEEELPAEIDLKKGMGYVATCLKCLQEAKSSQLKVLTDKLLELRTAEDIPVIPHTRKRPRKFSSSGTTGEVIYHCATCGTEVNPADRDVHQNKEGKFLCAPCAGVSIP